jgi:hypothetical protein
MLLSTSTQTSTKLATGIAYAQASSSVTVTSGLSTIELENTGSSIPTAQTSFSFSNGIPYTLLAYNSGSNMYVAALPDNEIAPATGNGKIRIADLSPDAGNLDIYMAVQDSTSDVYTPSAPSAALNAATILAANLSGTTSYRELAHNTYHIWVTGANDKTDLRLDIPSITINDQQITTLILTSTTGGVLVDGLLISQPLSGVGGAVVAQKNTNARVRIASNFSAGDNITAATVSGKPILATTLTVDSPLSKYSLVPAGTLAIPANLAITITALSPFTTTGLTTVAGNDYTLLTTGTSSGQSSGLTYVLLSDDNTRPTTGYAKLRLINGNASTLSLVYNSITQATGVAPLTSSPSVSVQTGGNTNSIVVGSLNLTSVNLQSQGVYSLFMFNNASSIPSGYVMSKDR